MVEKRKKKLLSSPARTALEGIELIQGANGGNKRHS
jgi:hypothetical protein